MVKNFNDVKIPQINLEIKKENLTSNGGAGVFLNTADRRWGILNSINKIKKLKKRERGFSDNCYIFSLLSCFCAGLHGLNSLDVFKRDKHYRDTIGIEASPDPTSMGEYLRGLTNEHIDSMNEQYIKIAKKIINDCPLKSITYRDWLYCFVDGSLLEVSGDSREGIEVKDRNGNRSLLMMGFFLEGFLSNVKLFGGNEHEAPHFKELVAPYIKMLRGYKTHFLLDSAYYDHKILEDILEAEGFHYTITVNKSTKVLENLAMEQPEEKWKEIDKDKVFGGIYERVYVSKIKYWAQDWSREHNYVAIKMYKPSEFIPHYAFVLSNREDLNAEEILDVHKIKSGEENQFKNLLNDMNLHHPPMQNLNGNRGYYMISGMAHNILQGIRKIFLAKEHISSRTRTIINEVMKIPAIVTKHARKIYVTLEERLLSNNLKKFFSNFCCWYPLLR